MINYTDKLQSFSVPRFKFQQTLNYLFILYLGCANSLLPEGISHITKHREQRNQKSQTIIHN